MDIHIVSKYQPTNNLLFMEKGHYNQSVTNLLNHLKTSIRLDVIQYKTYIIIYKAFLPLNLLCEYNQAFRPDSKYIRNTGTKN
jgi:hypothetical protein